MTMDSSRKGNMAKRLKMVVVLVDRANYGRLRPVMLELRDREEVDLHVVCAGTMMLDRFGKARDVVAKDGFTISGEVYMEVEGSVPSSMAKSIGLGIIEFASEFQAIKPDFVILIGDRYEALSAAVAAAYQNICIIHLQGGEVTGSIDESARHAITKLSHYHFPATRRSGEFILAMGEAPGTVFPLGCPSADVVADAAAELPIEELQRLGVGRKINFKKPYLLVVFHPVTTEFSGAEEQMQEVLGAIRKLGEQVILLWPNIDAGSDGVSQAIRRFREHHRDFPLHAYKNFEPEVYIPILGRAACAIGNSSSFIRDASYLGTPVVLVGSRQDGRECCSAVHRVEPDRDGIIRAVQSQLVNGRYSASDLYGSPGVSRRIVDAMLGLKPYSQKRLGYAGIVNANV
jgi:UDP-hydrolysing UDP-N-acetyl-D-glucosamine 2-epimerase